MMSNFNLDVTSEGEDSLLAVFALLGSAKVESYRVTEWGNLVLFWSASAPDSIPLAYPHTSKEAATFAWGWLAHADRGNRPDIDGSVKPSGWRVRSGAGEKPYTFAIVTPIWAHYHK